MQHFIDFSIPTKASPNYVQQFALQSSAIPVFIKDLIGYKFILFVEGKASTCTNSFFTYEILFNFSRDEKWKNILKFNPNIVCNTY